MLTALYQGFHSLVCQRPNALRPDGGAQTAGRKRPAPCGWDDVLYLNQRRRRCCVRCCSSHESHRHTQCRWKLVRHFVVAHAVFFDEFRKYCSNTSHRSLRPTSSQAVSCRIRFNRRPVSSAADDGARVRVS